jgi:hypothetical protein
MGSSSRRVPLHARNRLEADIEAELSLVAITASDRVRCAWHEAGHATAYFHLGWPVRLVEIGDNGTGLTHGMERRSQPSNQALICLCGPVSESIFAGIDVDALLLDPAVGTVDHDMARRHLAEMAGDPEIRLRCAITAAQSVVEQRSQIGRIAEALLARGRLDARALETLFRA